jgi:hypothetical protein
MGISPRDNIATFSDTMSAQQTSWPRWARVALVTSPRITGANNCQPAHALRFLILILTPLFPHSHVATISLRWRGGRYQRSDFSYDV